MQVLRKFKPPFQCYGAERYVINPYTACSHGCIYCYGVRFWQKRKPEPKEYLVAQLKEEAKRKKKILPVEISTIVDPYIPMEKETETTRRILELLLSKFPVILVTKSDLVLRDVDLLKRGQCIVEISLTTSNPQLERILEPGAPSFDKRVNAIGKLVENGILVSPRIDPIIPHVNDDPHDLRKIVQSLSEAGAKHITSSTMKADFLVLRALARAFPSEYTKISSLYQDKGQRIGVEYYLPEDTRINLMGMLYEICNEFGISFATCREGFTFFDTGMCDGLHLLQRSQKVCGPRSKT